MLELHLRNIPDNEKAASTLYFLSHILCVLREKFAYGAGSLFFLKPAKENVLFESAFCICLMFVYCVIQLRIS